MPISDQGGYSCVVGENCNILVEDKMKKLVLLAGLLMPVTAQAQHVLRESVTVTPVVSTAPAYTAGDAVGGLMTFTGALPLDGDGELSGVMITDLDKQGADLDLILFSSNPTGTTVTDNSALDVADADIGKIVGVVNITSDSLLNDNSVTYVNNQSVYLKDARTRTGILYGVLVARGTPTYTSTSALTVTIYVKQN